MPEQGSKGHGRQAAMARATSGPDAAGPRRDVLRALGEALRHGDEVDALRQADRARRIAPPNADILRINARLLGRQGQAEAALKFLLEASENSPGGEIDAEIVEAMLALDRFSEAEGRLADALRRYAVTGTEDPLARAARRIISDPRASAAGWIALSPGLELIGEIRLPRAGHLRVRTPDGRELPPLRAAKQRKEAGRNPTGDPGVEAFAIPASNLSPPGPVSAEIEGTALLGSGLAYPPDFALDGRTHVEGRRLTGWVQLGWAPSHSPELMIEDERGGRQSDEGPARSG